MKEGTGIAFFVFRRNKQRTHEPPPEYFTYPAQPTPAYQQPSPSYGHPPSSSQERQEGMNPLMAAGLGAAAGGLVGYALGQQQGQEIQEEEDLVGASVSEDIDEEDMAFSQESFESEGSSGDW